MTDIARPHHNIRRSTVIGMAIIAGTFGVIGLWAAITPLNSAVIGHGVVEVESNRQTVQHFEGGIISKILVREGDKVTAGQVLFQLDPIQTTANLGIAKNQLFNLVAKSDRLSAEREGRPSIRFSDELERAKSDPVASLAMMDESRQFEQRRVTLTSQFAILNTRVEEYKIQVEGLEQQRVSLKDQISFVDEELKGLTELYKSDLVPKPRLLALQGEHARLQGQLGELVAEKAKAQVQAGETQLQMRQLRQQFNQDVSKDTADVQTQIGDIRQRFIVAQDAAKRINITAPMSGTAQSLRVFTEGAVIRPGDPLIDIAPSAGHMVIQARFSPNDIDSVHAGQDAELRFSTFHSRTIPVIEGKIKTVSQDRLADEATHTPYYLAIINISEADLPPELRGKLVAGLPAEVIVQTGARTALQYIWQPLTNALHQTMRER